LPSYSSIRRVLLQTDYQEYSARLARFFDIQPMPGEMVTVHRINEDTRKNQYKNMLN